MRMKKGLLAIAKVLEWLGIVWVVYCAGDALLAFRVDQRVSDAIADAVPILLAGGLGCILAWSIALLIRGHAETA
jgi:hypothetical protein